MATKAKPAKPAAAPKPPDLVYHNDVAQGTAEWFEARRGKLTASEFSKIMANSEERLGRARLMRTLCGEIITEEVSPSFQNGYMKKGKEVEPEIRAWYSRTRFVDVEQTGFVFNPEINAGWSPDGLVPEGNGCVEFKWTLPELLIEQLEKPIFPGVHRAQCHGALLVGRRDWCDLVIYSHRNLQPYVARVERAEALVYHQEIRDEIATFNFELKRLVERIRAKGRI